ncbi:MAG TPA: DUF2335 domain-containing protein [Longimicrobium sp.]|nr:DUF2335 domain-containing protein [Longimicrobium sp.]
MASRRKRARGGGLSAPGQRQNGEGRGMELRPSSVPLTLAQLPYPATIELRNGPIPDAEELARYGVAHPDAPRMILDEFHAQATHRRDMERQSQALESRMVEAAITSERVGTACALLISLCGFACATVLVVRGYGVEGTVMFGVDAAALVFAFIHGRPRAVPA